MKTTGAGSQTQLWGKTYEAKVKYVCKKMPGGGCAITTFCVLAFGEETVTVHFYAKASCVPQKREADYSWDSEDEKKTYQWKKSGNLVTITGFDTYGTFEYQNNTLISSKDRFEDTPLAFVEKLTK